MKPLLPLSLKEAANMTGITKRQIVSLAGYGKLPVHFQYCSYVALFKSFTDQDGDAYVYQNPASDSVPVLGIFRSVTPPVLQQNLRIVSIRPAAIECVEVYSGSPPGVPEGFALARVTGPSIPVDDMLRFLEEEPRADAPRLDESPIGIENWLFMPEDLDRFVGAPAAEPSATSAPDASDDATPVSVQSAVTASAPDAEPPAAVAPEVTPDDDDQAESATPAPAPAQNTKPLNRQPYQEDEILRVIHELGYEADALPKFVPGKPWVKSAVRKKIPSWSDSVFDLAWERLRKDKRIQEAG
jgi:hypothetical protein